MRARDLASLSLALLGGTLLPAHADAAWAAAWTAAAFPATPVLSAQDVRDYAGASVRQNIVLGAGGTRLRVRMTNALGSAPLSFSGATLDIAGRSVALGFGGAAGATLPPRATLTSDPLPIPTRRFQHVAITIRYPAAATPSAHLLTVMVRYGDGRSRTGRGPALAAAVEVDRPHARVIVVLGDSITEGARAQPQSFTGWPEMFARRRPFENWSVVNAGIHGNRLLRDGAGPNALARFDRDVLSVAGVRAVILLEGINDLGWGNAKPGSDGPVSAQDVIAAYRQIIERAHAAGLRIIGATLLPYRGSLYFTEQGEAARQAVNRWIRTAGAFDAVVDFERVMADPNDNTRLAASRDCGDHLHPSDAGYAAMAAAIDPSVLRER